MQAHRPWSPAADPSAQQSDAKLGRTGAITCFLFVAVLGCAFWAGAVFASQPWVH
jgi:hypothetical protein